MDIFGQRGLSYNITGGLKMCDCYVCKEPIMDFEKTVTEVVNKEKYIIHNRPGCKDIWDDIRFSPNRCFVCNKITDNLDIIRDNYIIICSEECKNKIHVKLKYLIFNCEKCGYGFVSIGKRGRCPDCGHITKNSVGQMFR
jgi:hypothetical protein